MLVNIIPTMKEEDFDVKVQKQDGTITQSIKIPQNRIDLGFIAFSGTNKFAYVYYTYPEHEDRLHSEACVCINIFSICEDDYVHDSSFYVCCRYRVGNVEARISQVNGTTYNVIVSDLCNYEYISVVQFTSRSAQKLSNVDWPYDHEFRELYYFNQQAIYIIEVETLTNNNFEINLFNIATNVRMQPTFCANATIVESWGAISIKHQLVLFWMHQLSKSEKKRNGVYSNYC